ncbi:MAG: hypothetical protein NVS1B7_8170 [Candidatus Saccharimonadales bacterium]
MLLFGAVIVFVLHNSTSGESLQHSNNGSTVANNNAASHPLDQVSSADIAVNLAHMTGLAETNAVANYADSFNTQSTLTADHSKVVSKPQVITATAKSRKDILAYTTQAGDTVSSLASKFGVTSESIKNTNSITSDELAVNQKLTIPPENGIVYIVSANDTIKSLALKYSVSEEVITNVNDAEVVGIKPGEQILIPGAVMPIIRPVVTRATYTAAPTIATNFSFGLTAQYGDNGYAYGWCTWGVANRRAAMGRPVPNNLGNANTWYIIAQREGLPTGSEPAAGAVAVNQAGNHVSLVEQVNGDGSFWVWEMNARGQRSITDPTPAGGWAQVDYRLVSGAGGLKFIY